jgi:hypothetical protein
VEEVEYTTIITLDDCEYLTIRPNTPDFESNLFEFKLKEGKSITVNGEPESEGELITVRVQSYALPRFFQDLSVDGYAKLFYKEEE